MITNIEIRAMKIKFQCSSTDTSKGPSIKNVRIQEGLSIADILWTKGVQMRTSALSGANTSDFFKFMVCPHGQGGRGLSQCEHFVDSRWGLIFRDFVRTSFMDGP